MRNYLLVLFLGSSCLAAVLLPPENGQEIQGYQDGFNDQFRRAEWLPNGPGGDVYIQQDGVLKVGSANGDPNHILLGLPDYNPDTQEILARIRVTRLGWGDANRGGVSLAVGGDSRGVNFHFRYFDLPGLGNNELPVNPTLPEETPGNGTTAPVAVGAANHLEFLNDLVSWGPELYFFWQTNVYYWVRFKQELNSSGPDLFAKIWKADGQAVEPPDWQINWDYYPFWPARSGLAGLAAQSGGGFLNYECDYVLIKATGLPVITVGAPEVRNLNVQNGNSYHLVEDGIGFEVTAPFDISEIQLLLNGEDRSTGLTIGGSATEKTVLFSGLETNKNYNAEIRVKAASGAMSKKLFSFSTLPVKTEITLQDPGFRAEGFSFKFEPLPGKFHQVYTSENLNTKNWLPAFEVFIAEDGPMMIAIDPAPSGLRKFYRVFAE